MIALPREQNRCAQQQDKGSTKLALKRETGRGRLFHPETQQRQYKKQGRQAEILQPEKG